MNLFGGGLPMIGHQLSLRDTIDRWRFNPGLERRGYHQMPLCGESQWYF
jgi:hypothetical protein